MNRSGALIWPPNRVLQAIRGPTWPSSFPPSTIQHGSPRSANIVCSIGRNFSENGSPLQSLDESQRHLSDDWPRDFRSEDSIRSSALTAPGTWSHGDESRDIDRSDAGQVTGSKGVRDQSESHLTKREDRDTVAATKQHQQNNLGSGSPQALNRTPPELPSERDDRSASARAYIPFPGNKQRYAKAWSARESRETNIRRMNLRIQKEHHPWAFDDWRSILRLLETNTLSGESYYQKRLEIVTLPRNVHAVLSTNASEVILEVMLRTGSHLQVQSHSGHGDNVRFNSLSMLGTALQNDEAFKLLSYFVPTIFSDSAADTNRRGDHALERHVQPKFDTTSFANESTYRAFLREQKEELGEEDIRALEDSLAEVIMAEPVNRQESKSVRAVWTRREDRIRAENALQDRPSVWNTITLFKYVYALTRPVPRLARRVFATSTETSPIKNYFDLIVRELALVFGDPALTPFISSESVDYALRFLAKHKRFAVIRDIWAKLEERNYTFSAAEFDALIAATAKAGDVHNFWFHLRLMTQRKIRPTARTWAAFHGLMQRRFPSEADVVFEAMRKRGLMADLSAAKVVIHNSIEAELAAHLSRQGSLDAFLIFGDLKYGRTLTTEPFEWLHIDVANRMIKVLLARGRVDDAHQVLEHVHRRNPARSTAVSTSTSTLNLFLTAALRNWDAHAAIAAMKYFRAGEAPGLVLDEFTFDILFKIAFHRRSLNLLRVVWRCACTAGHVGFEMQRKIRHLVLNFAPSDINSQQMARNQLWGVWAGKFAVGVADGLPRSRSGHQAPRLPVQPKGESNREGHDSKGTAADERSQPISRDSLAGSSRLSDQANYLVQIVSDNTLDTAPGSPASIVRRKKLQTIVRADVNECSNLVPTRPLWRLLRQALEMDLKWKKQGLGQPKTLLRDTENPKAMFATMMARGIHVPMKVSGVR